MGDPSEWGFEIRCPWSTLVSAGLLMLASCGSGRSPVQAADVPQPPPLEDRLHHVATLKDWPRYALLIDAHSYDGAPRSGRGPGYLDRLEVQLKAHSFDVERYTVRSDPTNLGEVIRSRLGEPSRRAKGAIALLYVSGNLLETGSRATIGLPTNDRGFGRDADFPGMLARTVSGWGIVVVDGVDPSPNLARRFASSSHRGIASFHWATSGRASLADALAEALMREEQELAVAVLEAMARLEADRTMPLAIRHFRIPLVCVDECPARLRVED